MYVSGKRNSQVQLPRKWRLVKDVKDIGISFGASSHFKNIERDGEVLYGR